MKLVTHLNLNSKHQNKFGQNQINIAQNKTELSCYQEKDGETRNMSMLKDWIILLGARRARRVSMRLRKSFDNLK